MQIIHSKEAPLVKPLPEVTALLQSVCERRLRAWVERISVPRHFVAEAKQNQATGSWLRELLQSLGYDVTEQGSCRNIVAMPPHAADEVLLVGAHYDSVPGSPGADDNGSALAAMLGCAAACASISPRPPVIFVAFNREEEGFLGSREFVESFLPQAGFRVRCAHILEMVGCASDVPGSQRLPTGLPIRLPDAGDFLGLLANANSAAAMKEILGRAATYTPQLPVLGLTVVPGAERAFPVLARSDHVPFWAAQIPALMWTDTAEFRNPNYHTSRDTPETLDYPFLKKVTQALIAAVAVP